MWPLILSAILHVSLFTLFNGGQSGGKGQGENMVKMKVNIVDKPSDKEIKNEILIPDKKTKMVVKKKTPLKQKYIEHKCEKWYGGVGIKHANDSSYIVSYVGKGYPADRAGILVGDLVINGDELRGKPGTYVTIKIMRGTKSLVFQVVREKICTKDIEP